MFTNNCGFFIVARLVDKPIQRGCKKPQSAVLLRKKKAKIVEKPQFCHNESGHMNRLRLKTTNNSGSDKLVAFIVFINRFINKIGLFSGKTVLSNFYMKYSISHWFFVI